MKAKHRRKKEMLVTVLGEDWIRHRQLEGRNERR